VPISPAAPTAASANASSLSDHEDAPMGGIAIAAAPRLPSVARRPRRVVQTSKRLSVAALQSRSLPFRPLPTRRQSQLANSGTGTAERRIRDGGQSPAFVR
jgi:hypothetical protein